MTKNELSERFAVNLERERAHLGLTQAVLAKKLGLSLTTYKNILNGSSVNVPLYALYQLHKLTGKLVFELCDFSIPEKDGVFLWRGLSKQQQAFVKAVCDMEAGLKSTETTQTISVMIPTNNFEDGMIWDSCTFETMTIGRRYQQHNISCGLKVTTNHMHPAYVKGDVLLMENRPPRDGDVGLFLFKPSGRAFIRKYHQTNPVELEPITNFGETFRINPNSPSEMSCWLKFGVIVSKAR